MQLQLLLPHLHPVNISAEEMKWGGKAAAGGVRCAGGRLDAAEPKHKWWLWVAAQPPADSNDFLFSWDLLLCPRLLGAVPDWEGTGVLQTAFTNVTSWETGSNGRWINLCCVKHGPCVVPIPLCPPWVPDPCVVTSRSAVVRADLCGKGLIAY